MSHVHIAIISVMLKFQISPETTKESKLVMQRQEVLFELELGILCSKAAVGSEKPELSFGRDLKG